MSAAAIITAADATLRLIQAIQAVMVGAANSMEALNAVGARIKEAHEQGRPITVDELEALMDAGDAHQAKLLDDLRKAALAANG